MAATGQDGLWGGHADQIYDAKTKELKFEQEDLVK